ncbi:MAG: class I SAM-dependent methyltransferase [Chloroflexi bacterium]|jgi:ubiquinone/menaquinone biosynthesis C-methylase UbiE|nr:class I SAM-dependent methyltransferase [Chloroflexota bacterium]
MAGTTGSQGAAGSNGRYKSETEFEIEGRWREKLLEGASAEDFQRAYDELHAEFLQRQDGEGEIYAEVNPRSSVDDRIRAVVLASIRPGSRVLEVGTGDGETAYLLAQQGNHVLSTDVSLLALEKARARWGGQDGLDLRYVFGDARALEAPDASYDYVVSENLVEHISLADMRRHLAEAQRVLKPGGCYLLYTPSRLWSGRVSAGFHLHNYTLGELSRLLREYGFCVAWVEPRILHRLGKLWHIRGAGLWLACAWEALLGLLRVHAWPASLKARIIPSIMVCAQKPD